MMLGGVQVLIKGAGYHKPSSPHFATPHPSLRKDIAQALFDLGKCLGAAETAHRSAYLSEKTKKNKSASVGSICPGNPVSCPNANRYVCEARSVHSCPEEAPIIANV